MKSKEEILSMLQECKEQLARNLSANPQDSRLSTLSSALDRVEQDIQDQYPLSETAKAKLNLGVYAIRELEGLHDELANLLCEFEFELSEAS